MEDSDGSRGDRDLALFESSDTLLLTKGTEQNVHGSADSLPKDSN